MPDDLEEFNLNASPFNFSATKIENLGATEYTLVSIAQDVSGSVDGFASEMEKCIASIVEACRKSPRADNLMLRLQTFNQSHKEVHGFKMLSDCNLNDYQNFLNPSGQTSLFDASVNAIDALATYGKSLIDNDYSTNGILIVITDGEDNSSSCNINKVKTLIDKLNKNESLESLVTILVGVGVDASTNTYLEDFKNQVGFTQYVALKDASSSTMAKLAKFVSQSISSQSSALGTGGPSQSLSF